MAHAITQCISVTRSFQRHEVLHLHECSVRTQHETYFIHILVATELFHPKSRGLLPSEDILLLLLLLLPVLLLSIGPTAAYALVYGIADTAFVFFPKAGIQMDLNLRACC